MMTLGCKPSSDSTQMVIVENAADEYEVDGDSYSAEEIVEHFKNRTQLKQIEFRSTHKADFGNGVVQSLKQYAKQEGIEIIWKLPSGENQS